MESFVRARRGPLSQAVEVDEVLHSPIETEDILPPPAPAALAPVPTPTPARPVEQRPSDAESRLLDAQRIELEHRERELRAREEKITEEERRLAAGRVAELERFEQELAKIQAEFEARLERRRAEDERALRERLASRRIEDLRARVLPIDAMPAVDDVADRYAKAGGAREIARLIRDELRAIVDVSAFSLAVHGHDRDDVVYRYRFAVEGEIGEMLKSERVDDGSRSPASTMNEWFVTHRTLAVSGREIDMTVAQYALRTNGLIGIATLCFESAPSAALLHRLASPLAGAASHLDAARRAGRLRAE
jgi:hypothetical protein